MPQSGTNELDKLITEQIIDVLKNGEVVFDRDGNEVGRKPPSAAFITSAIKWRGVVAQDGTAAEREASKEDVWDMLNESRSQGGELPPPDTDE